MIKDKEKRAECARQWRIKNKQKLAEYNRSYYAENKERRKAWVDANREQIRSNQKNNRLKNDYGITLAEYESKMTEQDGNCAICKRHHSSFKRKLAVDHNHQNGRVRGLLCFHCNAAIGQFQEDITRLRSAIEYLTQYSVTEEQSTEGPTE